MIHIKKQKTKQDCIVKSIALIVSNLSLMEYDEISKIYDLTVDILKGEK